MSRSGSFGRIRALVLTGVCAAALGFSACGDDEEEPATSATTEAETTETETTEADSSDDVEALREQFNASLLQTLTTTQNLSKSQAECAIAELQDVITDDVLEELNATGTVSSEVQKAAVDAGIACQDE